jgi:hypothetical protein
MKVFEKFLTQDGFNLWWLHDSDNEKIEECDLYYDEHNFMEACKEIVLSREKYVNYGIDDEIIEGWQAELWTKIYNQS